MKNQSRPRYLSPTDCALRSTLGIGILSLFLGCSTSPRTTPPDATSTAASGQLQAPAVASSEPPEALATPPSSATTSGGSPHSDDITSPPRVFINPWVDALYLADFPTSISERGDRIAAIVSMEDTGEIYNPEWLVIKNIQTDKIEQSVELIGWDLYFKLWNKCHHTLSPCIQEVEQRVAAANAVLAKDRWRRLPCFRGSWRLDRIEGGCEQFLELDATFKDPWLIISQRGRVLLKRSIPRWIYRDPSCKENAATDIESIALDPQTGILVVGLQFWGMVEGCAVPRWDFHPIRLPMLRSKATQGRDGEAP